MPKQTVTLVDTEAHRRCLALRVAKHVKGEAETAVEEATDALDEHVAPYRDEYNLKQVRFLFHLERDANAAELGGISGEVLSRTHNKGQPRITRESLLERLGQTLTLDLIDECTTRSAPYSYWTGEEAKV